MSRTQQFARAREKCALTKVSLVAFLLVTTSFHLAAQGTWTRKADMPTARVGATASVFDNRIYVFGGYASGSIPNLPTNEAYNPQTNTWDTGLLPMPTARSYVTSAVLNGKICLFGGGYPDATAANEAYTPATNSWDTTGVDLPWPRRAMSAAVVDDTIYVVGGSYDICDCCAYDPANPGSAWQLRTPMPVGAAYVSTTVYNGLVYTFGGGVGPSTSSWTALSDVRAYDPKTNQWTAKKPMPTPRFGLQTYLVGDSIYAIGGSQAYGTSLATVEVYHPLTDTWQQRPPLPQAVVGHSGAVVKDSLSGTVTLYRLYVIGGTSNWTTMLNQVWEYDLQLVTSAPEHSSQLPKEFVLEQNYPNPFNPTTTIRYIVGGVAAPSGVEGRLPGEVRLVVYDLLGREVAMLVNERREAGTHQVTFDGTGLSSGIYICRMSVGTNRHAIKMLLTK